MNELMAWGHEYAANGYVIKSIDTKDKGKCVQQQGWGEGVGYMVGAIKQPMSV
jgi:hypothetical protein